MNFYEVNFDGLVGPTHNYAGLSFGNVASSSNQKQVSTPRQAALQGLEKMKAVAELGIEQAVLPPLTRPNLRLFREFGFRGSAHEMIKSVAKENRVLLAAGYSASNMWTANAATVSTSLDAADGKVHLTPANLSSTLHRAVEAPDTEKNLRAIFCDESRFTVHKPLPGYAYLSDEGAANFIRLSSSHEKKGLEVFVYGQNPMDRRVPAPEKFPARQTLQACESIFRHHQIEEPFKAFLLQNPAAIDAGAFHNDVVSVGNENVLLYHEDSFHESEKALSDLSAQFQTQCGSEMILLKVSREELSLVEAVKTYLFNSQLLTLPNGKGMAILCPEECVKNENAKSVLDRLVAENNPITQYIAMDVKQSMMNGGGPACLRLRVLLSEKELASIHQPVRFTPLIHERLANWITDHYREQLTEEDLADPNLYDEVQTAAQQLSKILDFDVA